MADAEPLPADNFPPLPLETLIPGLPNEVAFNCLIRIPSWHHPVLCAVSKPIRSLVTSPAFFTINRRILKFSQEMLLIRMPSRNPYEFAIWFALHHTTNHRFLLEPIPPLPCIRYRPTCAVLGTKLYVIGGYFKDPSSFFVSRHVWVLDCLSHTWKLGPSLQAPRSEATAEVFNGKIYVMGGGGPFLEVLDPNGGEWQRVPNYWDAGQRIPNYWDGGAGVKRCAIVNDKLCGFYDDHKGVMYDLRTNLLEQFTIELRTRPPNLRDVASGDGVLCVSDNLGRIFGLDEISKTWKELKGVRGQLPGFDHRRAVTMRMRSVRGRLVLMWWKENDEEENKSGNVWCGEIEVKKCQGASNGDDLWAKVHWAHIVPQLKWVPNDWVSVSF